jgi:hypothetical protein
MRAHDRWRDAEVARHFGHESAFVIAPPEGRGAIWAAFLGAQP